MLGTSVLYVLISNIRDSSFSVWHICQGVTTFKSKIADIFDDVFVCSLDFFSMGYEFSGV